MKRWKTMVKEKINFKNSSLGIELGSTRIKAVIIDSDYSLIARGEYEWENHFENGVWTYSLEEVWSGLQEAYKNLNDNVKRSYGVDILTVGSIGFSGMMHGYLPFDVEGNQIAQFRTWRNTSTQKAAEYLTSLFEFNIPLRWSVAHLYQAILNKEDHLKKIDYFTTLSGYVHWMLTGQKVIGIGDASGMFPIDSETCDYDKEMMEKFNDVVEPLEYSWRLENILPEIKIAGSNAGKLTDEGARLLDPSGKLQSGIPLCPPEGDAGTGMVATNTVLEHTGNVSAGTSIFSMIVLEKALSKYYPEIDMVTTPTGKPVAMVHCNNFTSDINDWAEMFAELAMILGVKIKMKDLFPILFNEAMKADSDVGKLVSCNYYSGEPITGFEKGRPLLIRAPDSRLTLSNFMRSHIYSSLATLEIGMEILTKKEKVQIDYILGHGGFFKTEKVGQQLMADALKIPTTVMKTAGEGGPWGMALLAKYSTHKEENESLGNYLKNKVFLNQKSKTTIPSEAGVSSFEKYMERYRLMLEVEHSAIKALG